MTQQSFVRGQQGGALLQDLCHQQAVARVAVNSGQLLHRNDVLCPDQQLLESLRQQAHPQG